MWNKGNSSRLYFLAGLTVGVGAALLLAPCVGKGYQVYARGREAKDVANDAADVLHRGKRLVRPLGET